jgi:hypothetical protein
MEAILPLLGKRSGRISTAPSHQPIRRRRRDESEEKQLTVSASKNPTPKRSDPMMMISTGDSVLQPTS